MHVKARRAITQFKTNATFLFVVTAVLTTFQTASMHAADLGSEITPLQKPDIASAKMAIENLSKLASNQTGAEKVRTERLATVIKNLFTAEFKVTEQFKACDKDETEAKKLEVSAKNWLIPNAFGKVDESASADLLLKAKTLREKASQRIVDKQRDLTTQLQESDFILNDFNKLQDFGVVLVFAETVRTINERSLPKNMFKPSFTEHSISSIREFIQFKDEWLLTAKNAESAENFEEAMRYFSKAKDQVGKKRCALRIAQDFEKGKLYGTAIEYYEIAGDFKKAAAVRHENPDLRLESFKKLDAEGLFAKVAPCCVRILNGNGLGSGFFFKQGGYILTNGHVVSAKGSITVKLDDGRALEAKLVAKSTDVDLAIIRVALSEHNSIQFRVGGETRIGLPVSLIGYPEVDLPTATMNSGRVSNTNRFFQNNPVYQLDVSANHGNSGGPVVDECGLLVGILTFGLNDINKDRFNFAITGEAAQEFVKKEIPD